MRGCALASTGRLEESGVVQLCRETQRDQQRAGKRGPDDGEQYWRDSAELPLPPRHHRPAWGEGQAVTDDDKLNAEAGRHDFGMGAILAAWRHRSQQWT